MVARNVLLRGSAETIEPPLPVRAGPLTAQYEAGELRDIRVGGVEVVRRVYVAVRDRNWDTIAPTFSEVTVAREADRFAISFLAAHRAGPVDFAWRGVISGDPDGTIRFAMDGAARTEFLRNRIGFCILHPPGPCAGQPCTVEHDDGSVTEGTFPLLIAPDQPFCEMRSIAHEPLPGVRATVRFAGEIFEMEDQRNWTDDSYKTYCTPLRLPFPVAIAEGERVEQAITITVSGAENLPVEADAGAPTIVVGAEPLGPLPRLGLGQASHGAPLDAVATERLRALNLAHLRADLLLNEAAWHAVWARARDEATALSVALEVALTLPTLGAADALEEFAVILAAPHPPIARWLIFEQGRKVTSAASVSQAREVLAAVAPGVPIGGGTDAYFTELNRERPDSAALDFGTYSINPQVHAFDDRSLVETLTCQGTTVTSARAFLGDLPLVISPVTLRPRFNPNATAVEDTGAPDEIPFAVDPRQMGLFGAAWTVGSVAALAASGVASATYYETTGPRGVIETAAGAPWPAFPAVPGGACPLYHVLADLGEFAGGEVLPLGGADPLGAAVVAVRAGGRLRVLVANLRAERQSRTLALPGPVGSVTVRLLDESNAEWAIREPEAFCAAAGDEVAVENGSIVLDLLPYAVARIDAALPES
jgi:hypothetical protein